MTVGQLLGTISSREITEWMALYKIEDDEAREDEKKGGR